MPVDSAYSIYLSPARSANKPGRGRHPHLLLAMVTVGLLAVGQSAAQEGSEPAVAPEAAQAPLPATPDRGGKVCHYEEVTGSRMRKRICYTPEQREARERAARDMVREMDSKGIQYTDGSGG
ncbi:hypothetical protein QFW77_07425 [Luteimonas sp. RD2P54]|uniref:SPOR domain-containing protein n=1 Tax=Luteimonas endophytica TaxID=3042023 RepID=A0ABT6J7M2_9GAMM|nr:hypothetical protein [Luteimonas endophytica]MDH5822824.1 hypothetical protein [Luteimonas endophytica]